MPLPSFGTMTSWDTLKSSTQTIAGFGEDRAWDAVTSLMDTFNRQAAEVTGAMVETTTYRQIRYGASAQMQMQRIDEMGVANPQKIRASSVIGLPLEGYAIALQWTRKYFQTRKANEFAAQIEAATTASMRTLIGLIKYALMGAVNYNFNDYLVDHVGSQFALGVKALVNADGAPIPPGPNGENFNPYTHNHYMATVTLNNTWAVALVETVIEHYNEGTVNIWINRADEGAWTNLADFRPMVYATTEKAIIQEYGTGTLSPGRLNNKQIGWFRGCAVWVKPYWPQYYACVWIDGVGGKVLAKRVRGESADGGAAVEGAGDLQLTFADEEYPLRAQQWDQEYGIGVWNRTAAAVGYYGPPVLVNNNPVYVIPDATSYM